MRWFFFCLIVLLISSCNQIEKQESGDFITVSIRPQKYLVEQITGNRFQINILVPDGSGPETYELNARQMQTIAKSKAYFSMGVMDFEKSLMPKLKDLYPEIDIVNVSDGITFLTGHSHSEGHDSGNDDHSGHSEEIEDIDHENHNHQQHVEAIDPHIWLSLKTVKIQSQNILNYLVAEYPAEKDVFTNNYQRFISRLDSLDTEFEKMFSAESSAFIIYHPSLSYFARDYGIEQIAIELEGKEPSPLHMKGLIDIAKEKNIKTLFYSEQFDKRSASTIADQLGISITSFNPLQENIEQNLLSVSKNIIKSESK